MQNQYKLKNLKISAIIPAYNEAKNILNVLSPLNKVPAIEEIIVVSDGSTDDTVEVVRGFGGTKVIALQKNVGKTNAVIKGVNETEHTSILLCDADLINLNTSHLLDMIRIFCEGFDMVIMDKGSQPWVFRNLLKSVPAMSGTRIMDREHFLNISFRKTDRFQFENRINDYFLENGLSIAVTPADEVHDSRKFVKYPFLKGLLLDLKGGYEVLAADGPAGILKNLVAFRKIREISVSPNSPKRA
jgi:glycosyltransferase involved in cell wall biosynthesis